MKFVNTFDYHQSTPNITLNQHCRNKRSLLCKAISNKTKFYLDTNYWIRIRDVELGRSTDQTLTSILNTLRSLVADGQIICPISDENFYELLLQSDETTLNKTVDIIDELSRGVAILSSEERVKYEILYFLNSALHGEDSLLKPDEMIWGRVGYIYGLIHPHNPIFGQEDLILQKAFFDQIWSLTLRDVTNTLGIENIRNSPRNKDLSEKLTREKQEHTREHKSFKQLYLAELAGALDVYEGIIIDGMAYLNEQNTGQQPSSEEMRDPEMKKILNVIYNLFKFDKLEDYLPSFTIEAGLHAAVRHDVPRKFKKGDLSDFRHARAALPYFGAFFTENNLKDLVCRKNLSFDKKYECDVFSKPKDVLEYLGSIAD